MRDEANKQYHDLGIIAASEHRHATAISSFVLGLYLPSSSD